MNRRKHILVISQYFYPENFRINDICKEWVRKGYEVTVITGIPNYPEGDFFKGYGFFKKNQEKYEGIDVIRIPILPRKNSKIMLGMNYLSFVISGYVWSIFSTLKPDKVFIVGLSPITQALPGIAFAKRRNIPCYIHVQDLWPESVTHVTGIKSKIFIDILGKLVDYIYANCDHIFTTSKSFIEAITIRGVEKKKISYWPQYAEEIVVKNKRKYKKVGELSLVFTGNIGEAQGLDQLIYLSEALKKMGFQKVVHFTLVGEGRFKKKLINATHTKNVNEMFTFLERVSSNEIPKILKEHDVALLSLKPSKIFDLTIPAKLQTYLSVGMPIIGFVNGESKKIILESQAGLVSSLEDTTNQIEHILTFLNKDNNEMCEYHIRAKNYAEKYFNKTKLLNSMDTYLRS